MTTYITKDAAEKAGIKPRAICAAIKAGRLKAKKQGRDWQIEEADLAAFVAAERKPGPKPGPRTEQQKQEQP